MRMTVVSGTVEFVYMPGRGVITVSSFKSTVGQPQSR